MKLVGPHEVTWREIDGQPRLQRILHAQTLIGAMPDDPGE